jgi:multisubunit Na+/H+ antiporter MnhE subunit
VWRRKRIGVWLAWFAVLNLVWLALVATLNWQEEIAGVIASAIGATAAVAVQAQGLVHLELKLRWLGGLWRLPWMVVSETWLVFAALLRQLFGGRPVEGQFRCEFYPHSGDDAEDEARRALYKLEGSIAPNTVVVGYDEETGSMLLHELVERKPRG